MPVPIMTTLKTLKELSLDYFHTLTATMSKTYYELVPHALKFVVILLSTFEIVFTS
jgi:hypothetical protein